LFIVIFPDRNFKILCKVEEELLLMNLIISLRENKLWTSTESTFEFKIGSKF